MKRLAFITAMTLIAVTILAPSISCAEVTRSNNSILCVRDIESKPNAPNGTITITGVVAQIVRGKDKVFALIDTSEARECKSTGCARFYLPVKYEGAFPNKWDEVNVTGTFEGGKNRVFVATNVAVLQHLTFGQKQR